jgi:multiple sugar transport system permease protein
MTTTTYPLAVSARPRPRRRIQWAPILFLAAPLTLYFVWIIGPMFATGYIALTNWDGISVAKFVGLSNFQWLFNNNEFGMSLANNVRWLLIFMVIPTAMGLFLAMIFNSGFPGSRWFKIAFFSPLVISPAAIAVIWEAIYLPQDGLINSFLRVMGVVDVPGWLADRSLVLWCIIAAAAWRQVGYIMILYLAGLKNIDVTLIEAATVDGANAWQRFRDVIFPLLAPVTVVVLVISVIDSLRSFDMVAIMTKGGPGGSSQVLANFMYMRAFNDYRMGYAAATAVVLLAIMLCIIIPYLIHVAHTELEY